MTDVDVLVFFPLDLEVFNGLCHKLIAVFSEQKELR